MIYNYFKYYFKNLLCFLFVFIIVESCNNKGSKRFGETPSEIIKALYHTEIFIPDSLQLLNNNEIKFITPEYFKQTDLRMIALISGDCDACVNNIHLWDSIEKQIRKFENIKLYLIVLTVDPDYFMEQYSDKLSTEIPIIIDVKYDFIKVNSFPPDIKYHTFLLDHNNKLIIVGDPRFNKKLHELYFETISKLYAAK